MATQLPYFCLENFMDTEAGRLQSMGSQIVGHNRVTDTNIDLNDFYFKRFMPNLLFQMTKESSRAFRYSLIYSKS